MGYYEFRLCENNDPNARDSQSCLDEHLLEMADGSGTRYALRGGFRGRHTVQVQLPPEIRCSHCVLQTWVARNNTDSCPDSIGENGCGLQQFFVNCADVRILPEGQTALDSNFPIGSEELVPETPSTSIAGCLKACFNGIV
ncbi:uncharacterized protein [Macrobrachium rosenbergii]|uniref:uncharacterized protein n=1 Tax=Macrobrachium rosenbergii TaxID=79674 RepID=UPI0034D5AB93